MERTPRRARPAALAALALAVPMALSAAPAVADHWSSHGDTRSTHKHKAPQAFTYDALGDSYAAGFGTAPPTDACARSDVAYPHVLDGRMRIDLDDFAACSGAVAGSVGSNTLAAQLPALDRTTDLVTLTIGGNDIAWIEVVTACMVQPEAGCDAAVTAAEARIATVLPPLLDAAYGEVRRSARKAHVVVTGYPRLFSPEHGDYSGVLPVLNAPFLVTPAEQKRMNEGADELNRVIKAAADRAGFQFVDVTKRFKGHGVNAPAAWIGGVEDPELFHPTAKGQHAYGVALRAAIKPRDLR